MPDMSNVHISKIKTEHPFGDEKNWYAIYVKSRHELKVAELLTQKGISNFVPVMKQIRQWSDRKKKIKVPLFRGYVFVNIDLSKEKFAVLRNDGVVKFIGIRGIPSMIPEHEIRWLNALTEHSETVRHETSLQIGQKVSVIAGPFKGIHGEVIEVRNMSRLVITFESIAQVVSVEIAPDFVKKIN